MKTKLYRRWLKHCKHFDDYKKSHKKYASEIGDKFFEKYIKYSRLWHKIKIECDLNGCTPKGIHCRDHPLHSYCPSVRLNSWASSDFICEDFNYLYQTMLSVKYVQGNALDYMQIPEIIFDNNGNITLSYKKKTV